MGSANGVPPPRREGTRAGVLVADAATVALDACGALVLVVAVSDMFLTIFNYDGYTTLTTLFHRGWWRSARMLTRPLPNRTRHVALSIASSSMLPATVALWLGLEVTGFALVYDSGLRSGAYALNGASASLGTAFYFSAGAISSLTFGDVVARGAAERALVDLETIVGLATFTLALGYVVTAFDALGKLENLHGRVQRHAEDLDRPESILRRHFGGGSTSNLPAFLQALSDDLESYDQGLRRYPVVYYFHTRRLHRSIPQVFSAIGDLVALLRYGLPAAEPIVSDPYLAALHDGFAQTLERLRRSFVGPVPLRPPEPGPSSAAAFRTLQRRAHDAAGEDVDGEPERADERYREWLDFAHRQDVVLRRVAGRLGYDEPAPRSKA
jgi:hypothetical protein